MNYAANTFNSRKAVLFSLCDWLQETGKIQVNPMKRVPPKKKSKVKVPTRRAMTAEEIRDILKMVLSDECAMKGRRYTHSHYYPILLFLANTGCRPAEAIGLQVKKIHFKNRIITIDDSLARGRSCGHSKARTRKSTKTEDIRLLNFSEGSEFEQVLNSKCERKGPNDLVFESPKGLACNERCINETVLRPVMEKLGIPRRTVYAFRHSFATRCIQSGMDIKTVQGLTGHRSAAVLLDIYAEATRTKTLLPEI